MKKNWRVSIHKEDEYGKDKSVFFVIEAEDARDAFKQVDMYTGTYKVNSIHVEESDFKPYPLNR